MLRSYDEATTKLRLLKSGGVDRRSISSTRPSFRVAQKRNLAYPQKHILDAPYPQLIHRHSPPPSACAPSTHTTVTAALSGIQLRHSFLCGCVSPADLVDGDARPLGIFVQLPKHRLCRRRSIGSRRIPATAAARRWLRIGCRCTRVHHKLDRTRLVGLAGHADQPPHGARRHSRCGALRGGGRARAVDA